MLKEIKINNYALIDSIEMSFNSGMTSITGETGAGKSILVDGLSLVLGSRVDNSKIINKQTKKTRILVQKPSHLIGILINVGLFGASRRND